MTHRLHLTATLLLATSPLLGQTASEPAALPTVAAKTSAMQHTAGLLALDYDARAGKLYLEVPLGPSGRSADLLYVHSLPFGIGSNDIGLDRGQLEPLGGGAPNRRIVHFERFGPKLLLVESNQAFRSSATDPAEQRSVSESFPTAVLFGFKVEAEDPASRIVLVDASDLALRDVHGVSEVLAETHQGTYRVDISRSAIAPDRTKAFPRNTELEAVLTFTTDDISHANLLADVAPDIRAVTVREHQSFIALPEPGFTPRRFDPRSGFFPESYRDYSAPLGSDLDQQFIVRHRLLKRDPRCRTRCEPVAPIQYYVDRGAPEPIRSALVEGARWWDQAFQAAGWAPNTFRVDVLPADADPMDVRYNIIQWVHRYTRGYSYGDVLFDPRTGEILKGNVTLGSLRGRQDYLIAEALLAPYTHGSLPLDDPAKNPMLAMVLQRIRQLAAHETGHTLGLAHNYVASALTPAHPNGTSVMDYPHPWITLDPNGIPDTSHAYAVSIGDWDKVAIDFGYREFDHEARAIESPADDRRILTEALAHGLYFITDEDARPLGSAHPHAHLWDNGQDSADELNRILDVRAAALRRFGVAAMRPEQPLAQLEDTLVPLYLLHRYQTEAAAKEIGGLEYRYNVAGDDQPLPAIVSADNQRKALAAVLRTLSPEVLTLPEPLLQLLPPRPPGFPRTRESLAAHTGLTFDPIATAESAADLTLALLFHPERASRLVEYHTRDASTPSLGEVIDATLGSTRSNTPAQPLAIEVRHAVDARILEALLALASNSSASSEARAISRDRIEALKKQLTQPSVDAAQAAALARIEQWERNPAEFAPAKPVVAPPGTPIGAEEEM